MTHSEGDDVDVKLRIYKFRINWSLEHMTSTIDVQTEMSVIKVDLPWFFSNERNSNVLAGFYHCIMRVANDLLGFAIARQNCGHACLMFDGNECKNIRLAES